ncbi:Uu.00g142550.m01.CDS01 [Anthostomella pinea]|uniref:Uu.00g142550.m01.CDS01 n=1 Tax=Anthostomella pinea TaxID=933095 RepID=A0AAI8YLL7_9PEZI|nr:Uu.00g142550.m01.CDS01 [Anthostomella pinea]
MALFMRGKHPNSDSDSDHVVSGSFTFHNVALVTSVACTAFTVIAIFVLMWQHASHLSTPREQLHILRLCLFIIIYGGVTLLMLAVPTTYVYRAKVAEGYALSCFFLFLCNLLTRSSPNPSQSSSFLEPFLATTRQAPPAKPKRIPFGLSPSSYYRARWILIFQCPITLTVLALVEDITEAMGTFCLESNSAHYAHIWVSVLQIISLALAVISTLRTYAQLKAELAGHRVVAKLFTFKMLVGLSILQEVIFKILLGFSPSPLAPSATLSTSNIQVGLSLLIVACELPFFACAYHFAYTAATYSDQNNNNNKMSGGYTSLGWKLPFEILKPNEYVAAVLFAFKMKSKLRRVQAGGVVRGEISRYRGASPSNHTPLVDGEGAWRGEVHRPGDFHREGDVPLPPYGDVPLYRDVRHEGYGRY